MAKKIFYLVLTVFCVSVLAGPVFAEMISDNYTIKSSVFSGGGAPMSSDSYSMNATLRQPTPLEQSPPAMGDTYDNYPGFWYTLMNHAICTLKVDDLAARAKSGKIQLTWSHVDADQYKLYRKAEGGEYEFIATTTTTYCTFLDTNVTNGTTYYYKVTSGCSGIQGVYSNEASATPQDRVRR